MAADSTSNLSAQEPYVTEFETTIRSVDGCAVRLDQTYFYPEGGGQPADSGTLDGLDVIDVQKRDGETVHLLATDPHFEAGLPFAVDMDTDFVGKEALERAKEEGIDSRITPLTLDDSTDIALSGRPVLKDGEPIGYVQAGSYGYSIGESIAYTYVPSEYAEAGTSVQIRCEGELYDATVRDEPLFDPGRDKILR